MTSAALTERLITELADGMAADWEKLSPRILRLGRGNASAAEIDRVASAVAASRERALRRAETLPAISYPTELPVAERRDEIAGAIAAHPVVIVCGETFRSNVR